MREVSIHSLRESSFFQRSDFIPGFLQKARSVDAWAAFADRFEKYLARKQAPVRTPIPRLIHQVWLGGRLPDKYRGWTDGWRSFHPGWEHILWSEREILELGLVNERAFRESPSFGAKSDIARYEILEKFGGIYADTDFECLRPFDDIAGSCTFFAGTVFHHSPQVNNGLMGAVPGHGFIRRIREGLAEPVLSRDGMEIIRRTGAAYLTELLFADPSLLGEHDVIFPSGYFYPVPNFARGDSSAADLRRKYVRSWSYAIHYWETSWLPQKPLRALLGRWKKNLFRGSRP